LVQCKPTNEKSELTTTDDKQLITELIDQWHLDASNTNFESYFNAMSKDGIFIGTDPAENWTIEEFMAFSKPYFDQKSAWDFNAVDRNIYFGTDYQTAWFDELLDTWMGVCRGSGVVVKENEVWKIKHYVLSITIPNDNIEQVIELNKVKDSLFLTEIKN
jgi:hypothetical protein